MTRKRTHRPMITAVVAALVLAVPLSAITPPKITFTDTKLPNGLRLIVAEDHVAPVFSIAVVYNVGSRDERKGRTGFAHLFEHMMFKGSENVGPGEHFYTIFSNGGTMNGTTNKERTLYFETMPANQLEAAIFLEADLFYSGVRPAVNVGISVSRVGGSAQTKAMKGVAGRLRLDLAQYRELEAFSAFASDLDAATKRQLERGARTVEALKQGQYMPMAMEDQVMILYAVTNGFIDDVATEKVRAWEKGFHEYMKAQFPQVGDNIRNEKKISDTTEAELKRGIEQYKKSIA